MLCERVMQLLKTYGRVLTEPLFITKPGEKGKVYVEGLRERLIQLLKTYGRALAESVFITNPGEKDKR